MSVSFDQAAALAQQFLGDLGLVATLDPDDAVITDDEFVLRFTTGADALDGDNVVIVERATGKARFGDAD